MRPFIAFLGLLLGGLSLSATLTPQELATLNSGGAITLQGPVITPPAVRSVIYQNGVFYWPGDYSFAAKANYADTVGKPGGVDIAVTLSSAWGGWQPYALLWNFDLTGFKTLHLDLKPTRAGQVWHIYALKVGDKPIINCAQQGQSVDLSKYGPTPVVGVWASYPIPLSAFMQDCTTGTLVQLTAMYKFAIQDKTGAMPNTWYVDHVYFD